jgi:hypothetical protein
MSLTRPNPLVLKVTDTVKQFTRWLDHYGELSWDHQSYFAGPLGRRAKALYYRHKTVGMLAVTPMIFSEALLPSARRLFHQPMRLPIADAHYAMGFAFRHKATGDYSHLEKAVHFLNVLKKTRCPGFKEFGWGYPFDWITRNGVIPTGTPLITTTPYVYEAFLQIHELQPRDEWKHILQSITRHVTQDIQDFPFSPTANTCSYTPYDRGGVVNASAYRAFTLTSAAHFTGNDELLAIARRNLNFVLETQNADGSWPYAMDGARDFVDHFHTCFVLKALAKIYALHPDDRCFEAMARGVDFYVHHLFDEQGLPKPFARAPRLTVYRGELYDAAECINLCLLLRKHFPQLDQVLENVVADIANHWVKPDGSFRSRKLIFGWDNVPMHRWGQSQMFRALAYYLLENVPSGSGRISAKISREQNSPAAAVYPSAVGVQN